MRVTQKHLEFMVGKLNKTTGHNGFWNEIGAYVLYCANGGWQIHQVANEHGGVNCPLGHRLETKRDIYVKIESFIAGIEAGKATSGKKRFVREEN